jgi:hypothetical protein
MKPIYKIACLVCIVLVIVYLKPNIFGLTNILNNLTNKNIKNDKLINIICSYINLLNNTPEGRNFDYNNIIEQKTYMKPKKNNRYITKIVNNFINKTFIIKDVYIHNVKILEPINYYEINNGIYVPNIKFQIEIISDLLHDCSYRLEISLDLFVISHTNISILGIKTENIISLNENKQTDFDSIFIKMPTTTLNNNILDENCYENDSLIPTIDDID